MLQKLLITGLFVVVLISLVSGADWQCDPSLCPNEAHSQTCNPGDEECGYSGGVVYCYDTDTLNSPGSVTQQTSGSYSACDGGYVIDCEYYDGSSPFCDNAGNFWCDRKDSCYNVHRYTNCSASVWNTAVCDKCLSAYTFCDGSGEDGDGCEVQIGVTNCASGSNNNINSSCGCVCDNNYYDCDAGWNSDCDTHDGGSCSVGSLSGVYDCNIGSGGCFKDGGTEYECICIVETSYFETGVKSEYQTNASQHFLWGTDYGTLGDLLHLNNTNYGIFSINASGCLIWMDGTTACTAPTGGGMDYTNVAMTNVSETWDAGLNITMGSGGWFKGNLNWSWLQNVPSYVKDWALHFTHLSNFTDDILWTTGFNDTGDGKWLDDTTIGNCSVTDSCSNIIYTETDPVWDSNFTNMQSGCPAGNYSYDLQSNGTFLCRSDVDTDTNLTNGGDMFGDLNMTSGTNITGDNNLTFRVGQYGSFRHLWDSGSLFNIYELGNDNLIMDFTPVSGTPSWIFRYSGSNRLSILSTGTFFEGDMGFTQGSAEPEIYQATRGADSPTWNLTICAQKAYASCTGSNCDGGDLWLSGGEGIGAGADGSTYILTGGGEHSGETRIKINDTQNYIYGNAEFADNITQAGGMNIYDNGTCSIFNRGGSNIMLCD